jgi:phospholipid N-methyltransferase
MRPRAALQSRQSNAKPLEFFREFLRKPKEVGSLIPSSRFLVRRVLRLGEVDRAGVVVELGAGTGVITRQILARIPLESKLVAIEINRDFARVLGQTYARDSRFHLFNGSAEDLDRALARIGKSEADLVVSGIPFSTLDRGVGTRVLEAARRVLAPGGRLVAYQFRTRVRRIAEPLFGPAEIHAELLNLPPMRVYVWRRDRR